MKRKHPRKRRDKPSRMARKLRRKFKHHPWDLWFRMKRFRLLQGYEYFCEPSSMAVEVRAAAAKRQLKVSVYIRGPRILVERK